MKKMPRPFSSSSIPVYEHGEASRGGAAAAQKRAKEDRPGRVEFERTTWSHTNSSRRGVEERNAEEFDRGAVEEARERSFWWEQQAANEPQQEKRQERQETQESPAFDVEAAVKKLTETKEHFAELCRNYLANYKTQGADVSFRLSSSNPPCCTDSPDATCPEKERTFEERNAAGRRVSFSAAAAPPAKSTNHQPRPKCRRMPTCFDAFLKSDVLQLDYDQSNTSYKEELLGLESRTLLILDSFHLNEEQVEGGRGRGHSLCDGTILCKAKASECDALELCQLQSYQFAFKAAAVAEIVRLKSDLIASRIEAAKLPRDDTPGKGYSGVRNEGEVVKRVKLENESAAKELAQLRAEKTAKELSLAEIQDVKRHLERQISTCTCESTPSEKKAHATTRNGTALSELKSPALDGLSKQQQLQQDGHYDLNSRLKAMGGCHAGVFAEDEARLERICEASVEQEVVRLVTEKLEAVKADMGFFVKTIQSRIAGVAGKINTNESRVRPVRVGLFCLQFLIEKLLAKKAEIEASLVEKLSDNRLGLKLHFRS